MVIMAIALQYWLLMIRAAFYEKIFLNFKLMEWSAVHKKLLHEVIHISTNSITIIATLFTLIGKKKKKFLQASGMFILSLYPKDNWTMNVTLSYLWYRCNNQLIDVCFFTDPHQRNLRKEDCSSGTQEKMQRSNRMKNMTKAKGWCYI